MFSVFYVMYTVRGGKVPIRLFLSFFGSLYYYFLLSYYYSLLSFFITWAHSLLLDIVTEQPRIQQGLCDVSLSTTTTTINAFKPDKERHCECIVSEHRSLVFENMAPIATASVQLLFRANEAFLGEVLTTN